MMHVSELQQELKYLPAKDKLQLAHWLLDSVLASEENAEIGDGAEIDLRRFLSRDLNQIAVNYRPAYEQACRLIRQGRQSGEPRVLGVFKGLLQTSDDFDAPLPDEDLFWGKETDEFGLSQTA